MSVEDAAAPALSATHAVARTAAPLRRAASVHPEREPSSRRAALLTAPILPTLLKLAAPTVTVLVAQTAVNIAEAYYVGYLGTDALAGAALVFPIFMLMTMMSNGGLGCGVASSVARAVGAGRRDDAEAALFHAVVLAILAGGVFTLGVILGGPWLYRTLGGHGGALAGRHDLFQLPLRRCHPGVDRQSPGRGAARLRQCQGARAGDAGRRDRDDSGLAAADLRLRAGAAARHRRRRHRLRPLLRCGDAVPAALHVFGCVRPHACTSCRCAEKSSATC